MRQRNSRGRFVERDPLTIPEYDYTPRQLEALARGRELLALAPRCGAHCRTTGKPCRGYAMRNGRCRMHGGKSTGPLRRRERAKTCEE